MGDVVDTANKVLVGRVRGRTYSAAQLRLSVMEIWGNILKELLSVTILAWGWFTLSFQRKDYTSWVLS